MEFSNFSFDSAFVFLIKAIFVVVSFGLFGFLFLIFRQVQMMNKVLSTRLGSVFIMISLILLLGGLGLFGLAVLSFLT